MRRNQLLCLPAHSPQLILVSGGDFDIVLLQPSNFAEILSWIEVRWLQGPCQDGDAVHRPPRLRSVCGAFAAIRHHPHHPQAASCSATTCFRMMRGTGPHSSYPSPGKCALRRCWPWLPYIDIAVAALHSFAGACASQSLSCPPPDVNCITRALEVDFRLISPQKLPPVITAPVLVRLYKFKAFRLIHSTDEGPFDGHTAT